MSFITSAPVNYHKTSHRDTTPRVLFFVHIYLHTPVNRLLHTPIPPVSPQPGGQQTQTAKLAQSRPPPVRTYAVATSPPPLSPRTNTNSEKKHHSRRKSGKDYVVNEKKSTRPAPLSRRTTPQHTAKVAPGWSGRSSHRDRDEDAYGGRDSGESFPQFW